MKNLKFSEDGFIVNEELLKELRMSTSKPIEKIEVTIRTLYHRIAQTLRTEGYDVPHDPQEESKVVHRFLCLKAHVGNTIRAFEYNNGIYIGTTLEKVVGVPKVV